MTRLLILRPEPGASRTAVRAAAMKLESVSAPLFRIVPVEWEAPEAAAFDAVLLTSANAAREAGPALAPFTLLPCYAVGEATAEAARLAGFGEVMAGSGDGAALLDLMAGEGVARVFHPSGRDFIPLDHPRIEIERRAVYAAEAAPHLPRAAAEALEAGAVALIHSPRAGRHFASLVEDKARTAIAAISEAAAAAAGPGWRDVAAAGEPNDEALLRLAAGLCKADGERYGSGR